MSAGRGRLPLALTEAAPPVRWPSATDPDIEELLASGWRSSPFRLFLFKVHSRCNLNCDYCYVYHHADQSWQTKPRQMAEAVIQQATRRLREHAERHGVGTVGVGVHGGEPLLLGASGLRRFLEILRRELGPIEARIAMQSNGTLLTEEIAALCVAEGVKVGVSVDGDREAHDAHRRYHDGRPSHHEALEGISILSDPRYRSAYGPLLCTIQLSADPLVTYRALSALKPPGIDFLLPHGTWDSPPPGMTSPPVGTLYADWLIPIFDLWYDERPKRVEIRLFEEIMQLVLGGRSGFEALGLAPVNLVVIETDGSIEAVDTLKTAYHGAPATRTNVFDMTFDDALTDPSIVARQIGIDALCDECRACPIVTVCGGGYYPHRYRRENGFRNRSVFCADLQKLIGHVGDRVRRDLEKRRVTRPERRNGSGARAE